MNTRLISKYLLLLRKNHPFTQEALARELGISRQAVSKWENGTTIPDLETLLKLSKLYRITVNDLLEPNIQPAVIEDFEQITELPKAKVRSILNSFTINDIVKASMGASPAVNEFLAELFPVLDLTELQKEMGRIKIADIEDVHQQIIALINLEITR